MLLSVSVRLTPVVNKHAVSLWVSGLNVNQRLYKRAKPCRRVRLSTCQRTLILPRFDHLGKNLKKKRFSSLLSGDFLYSVLGQFSEVIMTRGLDGNDYRRLLRMTKETDKDSCNRKKK